MVNEDLKRLPDGATLRRLNSGLEIVRRKKHEPIDWQSLSADILRQRTGKQRGSKFLPAWNLQRVTDWLANEIDHRGWSVTPGRPRRVDVRLDEPVGLVNGETVHTIRIDCDGRWVHAYPVADRRS